MADELVRLYAERMAQPGDAIEGADDKYRAFEATFPFDETEDQSRAIDELNSQLAAQERNQLEHRAVEGIPADPPNQKSDGKPVAIQSPMDSNVNQKTLWPWSRLQPASTQTPGFDSLGERSNYLQLRSIVLAHGIGALPEQRHANVARGVAAPADAPYSRQELLDELLNSDSRPQDNRL